MDRYTEQVKIIEDSGLFNREWYLKQYPDVQKLGMNPIYHYLWLGAALKRDPSPDFSTSFYLTTYRDVAQNGINPLIHYIKSGQREGRYPNADSQVPIPERITQAPSPLSEKFLNIEFCRRSSHYGTTPSEGLVMAVAAEWMDVGNANGNLSDYELMKRSAFFLSEWYLADNKDVKKAQADPIKHFLKHGWAESRNPGPDFEVEWYMSQYGKELEYSNPLIDFLRSGHQKGRKPRPPEHLRTWWAPLRPPLRRRMNHENAPEAYRPDFWQALKRISQMEAEPAIVIPVYNAPEETDACLTSILRNTTLPYRVIVIDDASPDDTVRQVLNKYRHIRQIELYYNKVNLGFTATVNRGIKLAGLSDVVFLNSDTLVTPRWLERLKLAAHSSDNTATATAVSNNAGAFSVPKYGQANPIPDHLPLDHYARAIAQTAPRNYPEAPTGNGFCLYVRRDCLNDIGMLDSEAFPRGYGEENDFCMRAYKKGWRHVIDDATLIYHVRSASFGSEKNELMKQGRQIVDQRYPEYTQLVRSFINSERMNHLRAHAQKTNDNLPKLFDQIKPRILYVISTQSGGTPNTNQDLMKALGGKYETFLLQCNTQMLRLFYFEKGEHVELERYILRHHVGPSTHRSSEYDQVIADWLVRYEMEIVHIRHIAWHSLGLIDIASALGIPIFFSFHDFYTVCPSVKLLDNHLTFCGGQCTDSDGDCMPELWETLGWPLKHAAVHWWQQLFSTTLAKCDAFITTTQAVKDLLCRKYPFLKSKPFQVIAHGRDFSFIGPCAAHFQKNETLRIIVPGNISIPKGQQQILELAEQTTRYNFELHIVGQTSGLLLRKYQSGPLPGVFYHGKYKRHEFQTYVHKINPHVGAVLSIWPETFCHTLTELWATGIPVIGYDIGAVGERLRETGAGWPLSALTSNDVLDVIRHLHAHPEDIVEKKEAVYQWQEEFGRKNGTSQMADQYDAMYHEINRTKRFQPDVGAHQKTVHADIDTALVFNAIPKWAGEAGAVEYLKKFLESMIGRAVNSIRVVDEEVFVEAVTGPGPIILTVRTNGLCVLSPKTMKSLRERPQGVLLVVEFTPDWEIKDSDDIQSLKDLLDLADYAVFPDEPEENEISRLPHLPPKYTYLSRFENHYFTEDPANTSNGNLPLVPSKYTMAGKAMIDWTQLESPDHVKKGLVSIVIPVLNNLDLTKTCIRSLVSNTEKERFEIVAVDNGSAPVTVNGLKALGRRYDNLKLVIVRQNMMFAMGCDLGAFHAEGEYVVFLNNDTEVIKGNWLTELLRPLREDAEVGVVGGKLLYPDYTVQHAGVAFGNKSKIPYHIFRGFARNHPAVNEYRPMSVVTGALLAMRRTEFGKLRGFDPVYRNGCEDIDLCFKVRSNLRKNVIYQPRVELLHHEGKTEGRGSINRITNRRILVARWSQFIEQDDRALYDRHHIKLLKYDIRDGSVEPEIRACMPVLAKA